MNREKIRTWLNIVFMIGAVVTLILYLTVEDRRPFFYSGIASCCVKMAEFIVRFTR